MNRLIASFVCLVFVPAVCVVATPAIDLSRHFTGLDGTFVLLDGSTGQRIGPSRMPEFLEPALSDVHPSMGLFWTLFVLRQAQDERPSKGSG